MPRTRNTPAKTESIKATGAKITGFDSHGARYLRMTFPRDAHALVATWESPVNLWDVEVFPDGRIAYTPLRELVTVEPKVAKTK